MNRQISSERRTTRRKTRSAEAAPVSPLLRILRGTGIALLAAALCAVALLLIASGVVYSSSDPDPLLIPVSLLVLAVSSLLCGAVAERVSGAECLPVGTVAGVLWVLLCFLLSLAAGNGAGALSPVYSFSLRIPQFLLVLFGSFLAKRRPRKVHSRRRR